MTKPTAWTVTAEDSGRGVILTALNGSAESQRSLAVANVYLAEDFKTLEKEIGRLQKGNVRMRNTVDRFLVACCKHNYNKEYLAEAVVEADWTFGTRDDDGEENDQSD